MVKKENFNQQGCQVVCNLIIISISYFYVKLVNFRKIIAMKIYKKINEIPYNENRTITVGSFDGVHSGHLQIIKHLKETAQKKNLVATVITFEPHPQIYFSQKKNNSFPLLTTTEEKISIFKSLGIDELFIIEFDDKIANLKPDEFVYYLKSIGFSAFVIGYNHNFGKDRKGDFEVLQKINDENKNNEKEQFEIIQVPKFTGVNPKTNKNNAKVSSTEIRKNLQEAAIEEANKLLGYNYFAVGKVIRGNSIGKKLGFPTANIEISNNKLLPKNGVYACTVAVSDKKYCGVANIGYRPTITNSNFSAIAKPVFEVHILDFSADIYDAIITVSFMKFLREEKKFAHQNELILQIQNDIEICRKYF